MTQTTRVAETVRLDRSADGAVATLVMEQGDLPINVFEPSEIEAMATAVESLDSEVGCLVLTGEPDFSAGADLRVIDETPQELRSAKIDAIAAASNRFITALRRVDAPVIAAITGVAAGGGLGFALSCDLIHMHAEATLNAAYTQIGLTPDNATPFFLVKTVGPYKARELLFRSEPVSAEDAVSLRLANASHDCSIEEFRDRIEAIAAEYAAGPTRTYGEIKSLTDTVFDGHLSQHLEEERAAIKRMSDSDLFDEGLSAFLEGRDPQWD